MIQPIKGEEVFGFLHPKTSRPSDSLGQGVRGLAHAMRHIDNSETIALDSNHRQRLPSPHDLGPSLTTPKILKGHFQNPCTEIEILLDIQ